MKPCRNSPQAQSTSSNVLIPVFTRAYYFYSKKRWNGRGGYVLGERSVEHEEGMNIGTQRGQRFRFDERWVGARRTPCRLHLLYTSSRTYHFVKAFFFGWAFEQKTVILFSRVFAEFVYCNLRRTFYRIATLLTNYSRR